MISLFACKVRLGFGTIATLTWSRGWQDVSQVAQPTIDQLEEVVEESKYDVVITNFLRTNLDELKRLLKGEGCTNHGNRMMHIRTLCENVMSAFHAVS